MDNTKLINDIMQNFSKIVPEGLHNLKTDIEKNLDHALSMTFEHMDLVTREEFDIQRAVLAKTRQKLEMLEKQVLALESDIDATSGKS